MREKTPPTLASHSVKIVSLQDDGFGVSTSGEVIPFALPQEEVLVEKLHYRRHTRVHKVDVIQASSERAAPLCQHFTQHHPNHCGGCTLQHMSAETVSQFKHEKVRQAFARYGINPDIVKTPLTVGFGLRRRTNMEGILKADGVHLGFHRMQSHSVLNMHSCHTLLPSIVALVEPMRCLLADILQPYQKAQIFMLQAENVIDMVLTIQGVNHLDETTTHACQQWAKQHSIRLTYKHGKHRVLLHEPNGVAVLTWGGVSVNVAADGFVQPTTLSDMLLADHLTLPAGAHRVADLFCGRGTLGLTLAAKGHHVTGFEWDTDAVQALSQTNSLASVTKRQLFDNPLTIQELNEFDAVVINPPRAGALNQVEACAQTNVRYGIYVSCNPETAARDLAIWTKEGRFKLKYVQPVDQFAGSAHVELVAHIEAA